MTSICIDDDCPLPEHEGECPEDVTLEMWRTEAKRARRFVGNLIRDELIQKEENDEFRKMVAAKLKVFAFNDCKWVVAHDHDDAIRVWAEHQGVDFDEYDKDRTMAELDPMTPLTFAVDGEGGVCSLDEGMVFLTMPAAAWALKEGRGWLGTTEE